MAYIDKITNKDTGESRPISPAADKVRVDNENFEGTDLDQVLDEVAAAIEEGGGGTVKSVTINGDTVDPDAQGNVNLGTVITQHQDISGKVDKVTGKGLSTNDYTTSEKTKLAGIAAGAEVNVQSDWNASSGDAAILNKPTILTEQQVQGMIDDTVEDLGSGTVESVTVSGTKHLPDVNGDVDLGNLRGQDGNSGVASADGVESVNNLNGGTTDTSQKVYVLGANQGKRLKDQIDYVYARLQAVYAALGNIAFWEGKPNINNVLPDLDWGMPKHTVTLALSLTNATVKHNGVAKSNGDTILVDEGGTLTLTIEPENSSYAFASAPSVSVGGNSVTPTDNGDGTYSVAIVMGGSDATLSITASGEFSISYNLTHCTATGPSTVPQGSSATIVLSPSSNHALPLAVIVTGATSSYNNQTGEIVISNATGAVTLQADAICTDFIFYNDSVIGDYSGNYYYIGYQQQAENLRAAIVVPREGLVNPCTWGTGHPNADTSIEQTTSTIPVPYAAEKVKIKITNSSYNISIGLLNSIGANQKTNSWDSASSTAQEFNLASYPDCTHIAINIKKSDDTAFTINSLADIGFDLTFE